MADLSQTPSSVQKGTGARTTLYRAGAALTAGQAVYIFDGTTSPATVKPADATSAAKATVIGIALNSTASGQPVFVQTVGQINLGATLVTGETYHASPTAGGGNICPVSDIIGAGGAGTGCTLDITVSTGAIATAVVNAAGSGYPKGTNILAAVSGGGGTGGKVRLATNSTGGVCGVVAITAAGTGYSDTTGAATAASAAVNYSTRLGLAISTSLLDMAIIASGVLHA